MITRKSQIRIELKSDLLVSDGAGYNTLIDQDVYHDKWGLPMIPAKRLKGCLRESALELNDWGRNIDIIALFGESGDCAGCLTFDTAVLEKQAQYQAELAQMNPHFTHPQTVLNQFTYIRTQTAINAQTGIAKEGSLRSSRVVKSGCVFLSNVQITAETDEQLNDYEKQLKDCCLNLRHMGCNRTRGLGEVSVHIIPSLENETPPPIHPLEWEDTARYRLPYRLHLRAPLIIKSVNGGQEHTLDYIPGSMMLGKLAQWLDELNNKGYQTVCAQGEWQCANAYIEHLGLRMVPTSAALFSVKNQEEQLYDCTCQKEESEETRDVRIQLKSVKYAYLDARNYGEEKHTYFGKNVDCEVNYHHSRPTNKAIGRVWEGDEESQFYQLNSISAGQSFQGYIEATGAQMKNIHAAMQRHPQFRMGFNHSAEYGLVDLELLEPQKLTTAQSCLCKEFVLKLEAPLMEYDDKGRCSTNVDVLTSELEQYLPEGTKLKILRSFYRYRMEGGFQRQWHLRKPILDVWDKGTTIIYQVESDSPIDLKCLHNIWLGERVSEGYGEISVYPVSQKQKKHLKEAEKTMISHDASVESNKQLERDIMKEFAKRLAQKMARETWYEQRANGFEKKENSPMNDPALIQYLISTCKSYEPTTKALDLRQYLLTEVAERYESKTGNLAKQKKAQIAKKILQDYDEQAVRTAFAEQYDCELQADENVLAKSYYMAYLLEVKYACRAEK
ncbi:MAG: RAMP superfamily CRISPR-associated protein [Lachnospiraceae bacterium]